MGLGLLPLIPAPSIKIQSILVNFFVYSIGNILFFVVNIIIRFITIIIKGIVIKITFKHFKILLNMKVPLSCFDNYILTFFWHFSYIAIIKTKQVPFFFYNYGTR